MDYLWLIFALLSALTAALVAIFGKIGIQNIDTTTATGVRAVIMALFLIAAIFMEGKFSQLGPIFSDTKALFYIVLSGIVGALSWLFYFLALKFGQVTNVVPIDRLSLVFAIVLAVLLLGEKFTWKIGVGAALMAAGAILIALP